jgi:hypothetical protein
MSRINKSKVSKVPTDPDNVYLDLIITNLKATTTPPIPINFNENRNSPVISNSGNYNLSIVRFSLETQTLPVFIPIIQPNQGDEDLTIYSVTLQVKHAGITYTQREYINWNSQNSATARPPPPSSNPNGLQSDSTDYYYCFSFTWWSNLILLAFENAYNGLAAQLTAAALVPATYIGIAPPILQFNPDNQTCSLSAPTPFYNTYTTTSPPIVNTASAQIFFNAPLFNLFSSFPAQLKGFNATLGRTYQILVSDFGGSNVIKYPVTGSTTLVPPTASNFTQVFQEYSTIQNWCPVSAIVFTTSTIPVVPNQLSSPLIFAEGNVLSNTSGNNSNFQLVLTDLESGDLCYKPNLQYSPTAEYRRLSMTGTSPLSNIQVSVFWRNKLGNLIPFTLGSGGSATVKMLFTKVSAIYMNEEDDSK